MINLKEGGEVRIEGEDLLHVEERSFDRLQTGRPKKGLRDHEKLPQSQLKKFRQINRSRKE